MLLRSAVLPLLLTPHLSSFSPPPRCCAPSSGSIQISSESELNAALAEVEFGMVAVLLISRTDDKRTTKVKQFFEDKCVFAQRLLWDYEEGSAAEAELRSLGVDLNRTPLCVAFDNGNQILDWVAQTPSALLYGLQDAVDVREAYLNR